MAPCRSSPLRAERASREAASREGLQRTHDARLIAPQARFGSRHLARRASRGRDAVTHAILDHPDAEQHRLRRPAVPALLRLLARLRPDAHSQSRAWRLLHARRLSRRDHHLLRRQLLARGARRRPRRRRDRHPLRALHPAPARRQRAGPGAGDARRLVHHRRPVPADLDRRPVDACRRRPSCARRSALRASRSRPSGSWCSASRSSPRSRSIS